MPQVKDPSVKDGWYVNMAMHKDKPAPLSLGAVYNFKPGQERFLKADMILQSRATHQAFTAALANGKLVAKDQAKAQPAPAPEPPPPPPPEDPPPPPPEDPPEDEAYSRTDLQGMNKASLIELAEEMGLDNEGTKAELVDRILVNQE